MQRATRVLAPLLITALLAGCVSPTRVTRTTVGFNDSAAEMRNRVLLLNILRARDRAPMLFTRLTNMKGSISNSVTASLALPFGGSAPNLFTATPGLTTTENPVIDVAVLNDKAFIQGFTTRISPRLFKFFWDLGWSEKMLLFLFVRELDVYEDGQKTATLMNYPQDLGEFTRFRDQIARITYSDTAAASEKPESERKRRPHLSIIWEIVGPPHDKIEPATVEELRKAGLEVDSCRKSSRSALNLQDLEAGEPGPKSLVELAPEPSPTSTKVCVFRPDRIRLQAGNWVATAQLRSSESLVYYLGEMTRDLTDELMPRIRTRVGTDYQPWRLIDIHEVGLPWGHQVVVRHAGAWHAVRQDKADAGRTMQVFSLVNQILMLHSASSAPPQTGTVTVIGGS